jgi:TIR domain
VEASEEPRAHLFVSYSREDKRDADWIAGRLEASGYTVWIDRRALLGGTPWQRVIPHEIRNAEALLLILTPSAVQSEWVRREFFYALRNRIRIIPLLVRPAETRPEMAKHLDRIQTVTLWKRRREGLAELLQALGGLRGIAAEAPGTPEQAALQENTRLIFELIRTMQTVTFGASHAIFTGGTDWRYYIQVACVRDDIEVYAEAVGNRNLEPPYLLGDEQIEALRRLDWQEPNETSAGNYRRTWEVRSDGDRTVIAGIAMRTFVDVYGHPWGEELQLEVDLS